jgi:hypothetical protein
VQTVPDCLTKLAEEWDEVHLDHDLGGEHFVDLSRQDCGMEVVRWICLEPRPHLKATQFFVHSHNPNAATMMGMQLMSNGFPVELRPFGAPPLPPLALEGRPGEASLFSALAGWLRRIFRREPAPLPYGYTDLRRRTGGPDKSSPERLDLSWVRSDFQRNPSGHKDPPPDRPDFSWVAQTPPSPAHPPVADDPPGAAEPGRPTV